MAARPKTRQSVARSAARKQPARRRAPRRVAGARSSGGLLDLAGRHPFMTLALVVGAGMAVSAIVARPDARRVAEAVTPLLAMASRRWSEDVLPTARHWRDDMVPAAQARMAEAAAAIPPRRWWEDQIEQVRDMIMKRIPRG